MADLANLDEDGTVTSPFAEILKNAERPMIIVGSAALKGEEAKNNLIAAAKIAKGYNALRSDWNGFNILHTAASRVAGLELNFTPAEGGLSTTEILAQAKANQIDFLYLLGADEIDTTQLGNAFVVYQGSHGDKGAAAADVILPGSAYTEKNGTYLNLEGRVQQINRAIFPPNEARDDWAIIRALSGTMGKPFGFSNLTELRARMYEAVPRLAGIDHSEPAGHQDILKLADESLSKLSTEPLAPSFEDFYLTNPIARASKVMNEMSAIKYGQTAKATGTHD
jgi:NADH-quinone oxidoreductase subunit G